ncbi:acyl-CoA dehydrogenase family protein [Actinosynnema sp. NPDC059335]|uniref:acyl-CoA dehydrogenase family protein n=1 Tax=Actinosynnema sp. NPDC059335 TaxID=3346804 RepID=UPI003672A7EA
MHTTTTPPREELVGRATELVPMFAKNAIWQEEHRVLHPDTVDALTGSGLLRLTLPKRYGGYEADTTTIVDVLSELALGDGAVSWVGTVWTISTWLTGLFPDHVQDEVFGAGDVRISGTFAPSAVGVPTAGGIVLNGKWGFNSAAPQSTWNAHAAVRVVDGQQPEPVLVLVPMSDLEVVDDWHAAGMRGSGSVTTVAKDVFVPDERVLSFVPVLQEGRHASETNARSARWQVPFLPWASAVTTGTHHGLARAAYAAFMERLPTRKITYTDYEHQAHAPLTHLQVADATARIDEAGFHAHRVAARVDAKVGEPWSLHDRVSARLDLGLTVQRAREAIDVLANASGASSVLSTVPIQRIARDSRTIAMHAYHHADTNLELYGRVVCGLEPNTVYL